AKLGATNHRILCNLTMHELRGLRRSYKAASFVCGSGISRDVGSNEEPRTSQSAGTSASRLTPLPQKQQ
ncbi:hypothetical protein, partial [Stenotrophomonas sp. PS02298]|uniref:hypothetical protein n=1 Tax=Stenotrophomonas sp. PS02298 TaxID=2991424 RepID=UPI00249BC330